MSLYDYVAADECLRCEKKPVTVERIDNPYEDEHKI